MKKQIKFTIFRIVVFSLFSQSFSIAQTTEDYRQKIEIFEKFVEKQMEADHIPGLSVGFYKDDFVWTKGFGYADLENKVPATERSSYRLASNTKSMTAVAIVQLVEKGKIDLDRDIRDYIPYFPRKKRIFYRLRHGMAPYTCQRTFYCHAYRIAAGNPYYSYPDSC